VRGGAEVRRTLLDHGAVDVVTGTGDLELTTRIYLCGDIVRWVGRGVLKLPAEERKKALGKHFEAVDALAPATRITRLTAGIALLDRWRTALWGVAAVGGVLSPALAVVSAGARLNSVAWSALLLPLLTLALPALRRALRQAARWLLRRALRHLLTDLVDDL